MLKGPASILYGRIEPGGLINLNTKKPLDIPYYSIEQEFGSFEHYRTIWDGTGPLTADKSLLYRISGAYQNSDSFRDFHETERFIIDPSVTWRPTAATEMSLDVEVFRQDFQVDYGISAIGDRPAPVPIERSFQDPNDPLDEINKVHLGFNLTHAFNDNWKLQNRFLATFTDSFDFDVVPSPEFDASALQADNRTLDRNIFFQEFDGDVYSTNLDLTGKLNLWGTRHEVLVGVDYFERVCEIPHSG